MPNQIWDAALGELQLQVEPNAYETWFMNTNGVAHHNGEFVVGTANAFILEMLKSRMQPLIERTIAHVVGEPTAVRFQVLAQSPAADDMAGTGASPTPAAHAAAEAQPATTARLQAPPISMPPPSLNDRYTFDRFIVGKSNELAHAAARAVADNPGHVYNPLVLYSDVGLGKTHLMHAIGHEAIAKGLHTVYATTEEFTNEYISAIREGNMPEFRQRYRNASLLLLDDIQFISGKEQTQDEFFHTFNALHMSNLQIVITSDRPVAALRTLEERISSRLNWGLVADIQAPDLETRLAILRAKAEQTGVALGDDVLDILGARISRNIRELEGSLNRLVAYANLMQSPIDADLARRVIDGAIEDNARHQPTEQEVLDAVSGYYEVDIGTLRSKKRDKKTALARQVAMYLMRDDVKMTASDIARTLDRKDHTSVLHGCKTIANKQNADDKLRRDIIQIRQTIS